METNIPSWEPLLLLLQAPSKDALAQFLQALWLSRKSGLDTSQKAYFQEQLRLSSTAQLDQVSGCLLKLIKKSVYESLNQIAIQGLFPADFHTRLQRLLAELLQNFQHEWREEAVKGQVSLPRLRGMSWETLSLDQASVDQRSIGKVGIVHLKRLREMAITSMMMIRLMPINTKYSPRDPQKKTIHCNAYVVCIKCVCKCVSGPMAIIISGSIICCVSEGSKGGAKSPRPLVCDSSTQSKEEYAVNFQVSRKSLGAMLDSLHMIRDQLASITHSA